MEPELLGERSHVGSIVIARHVTFVERQLQARRRAANQVPGDQTFGLEAAELKRPPLTRHGQVWARVRRTRRD